MSASRVSKVACICATVFLLLSTAGCANHTWAPPAGKSAGDFEAQRARCSIFARNGGQGFAASGTQSFVAGAAVGNAIGNGIKANQDFNDCMAANGWTIADQTPERQAANQDAVNKLKELSAARVACVISARADPDFAPIAGHLPDGSTNKFSIAQLADSSYPTEQEATLFAKYSDRSIACRDSLISSLAPVMPPVSQLLRDGAVRADSDVVLLVRRQITWGEWSSRLKQANDDLTVRLRSVGATPTPTPSLTPTPATPPAPIVATAPVAKFDSGRFAYTAEKQARLMQCTPTRAASLVSSEAGVDIYSVSCVAREPMVLRCDLSGCSALR